MYDDGDELLSRVREMCLGYPESAEVESWGRPIFRAGKKMFVVYGSMEPHQSSLIFKPDPEERPALMADSRFFSPKYFGPAGWVALDLAKAVRDWVEVAELIETSYRQVALQRMLKTLDGG